MAGVGGALYGHYFVTFAPGAFYFDMTFITVAMLIVGGMRSVTGAVVGVYFLTFVNELFRRWEVDGFAGVTPPSGTANLVLAVVLLVTLILRPRGITSGNEISWPGDWSLPSGPAGAGRRRALRRRSRRFRRARTQPAAPSTTCRRPTDRREDIQVAKKLVLLTYTPRELDEEKYAKFIREIDYPAFRQNPDILDYSCWRVKESVQGSETFTHFDLMEVADLSAGRRSSATRSCAATSSAGRATGRSTAPTTPTRPTT